MTAFTPRATLAEMPNRRLWATLLFLDCLLVAVFGGLTGGKVYEHWLAAETASAAPAAPPRPLVHAAPVPTAVPTPQAKPPEAAATPAPAPASSHSAAKKKAPAKRAKKTTAQRKARGRRLVIEDKKVKSRLIIEWKNPAAAPR